MSVTRLATSHRRKLRTTNIPKRLDKELERRTQVATLLPNESSLARLTSAVLVETSEDRETGKTYLKAETAY